MPGKNKTPLIGWHPPAELSAWIRGEAERRGVPLSVILTEAVETYRTATAIRETTRELFTTPTYESEHG